MREAVSRVGRKTVSGLGVLGKVEEAGKAFSVVSSLQTLPPPVRH